MRQIRMLRAMWRELETGLRRLLHGHEGGNPGHSQGAAYGLPRQFPTLPGTGTALEQNDACIWAIRAALRRHTTSCNLQPWSGTAPSPVRVRIRRTKSRAAEVHRMTLTLRNCEV